MGMYLRVSIPYRYALPKSPTDSAIVEVFPLMESNSPYHDHINLSLESLQVPWAQINKKNEVFTFDPRTSFFPAYNSTSKIRPKMLPESLPLVSTDLGRPVDRFGGKLDSPLPMATSYADLEKQYHAGRNKEMQGLYEAYKPFLQTKLFSVRRFMEWAATQDDLVGIWNQGYVGSALLQSTTKKTYRIADKNEADVTKPSFLHLKISSHSEEDYQVKPEHLGVVYSQKVLGIAPYSSHPAFEQSLPHPVSLRYRFASEMDEAKNVLRHSDAGAYHPAVFDPPAIDWVGAGFPEISPSKTKTVYGREPVQVNFSYVERGFTKEAKPLIQRCLKEWNAPEIWFSNLVEPVKSNADYVPVYRTVQGNIVGLSALSRMERSYSPHPTAPTMSGQEYTTSRPDWMEQSYDSVGYGLHYSFVSDGFQWKGQASRQENFHSGPISRNFRWDDIPSSARTNLNLAVWSWDTGLGLHRSFERGKSRKSKAAVAEGYQPDLPSQSFEDEVTYLRCNYTVGTREYSQGLGNRIHRQVRVQNERKNLGIIVPPQTIERFRDNDKGREILSHLLNSGICLSAYVSQSEKGAMSKRLKGGDLSAIQSFLERVLVQKPAAFEVKMESEGVVSVTQKITRKDLIQSLKEMNDTLPGLSRLKDIHLRLESGEKAGQEWAYKVYFLKHFDGCGFSVLKTCPSFMTHADPHSYSAFEIHSTSLTREDTMPGLTTIEPSFTQEQMRLPFTVRGKKAGVPIPLVGEEVVEYLNTTAYGGYQYSLIHLRDGITLSDPVNTLPLVSKRGKIAVTRPFTYTSVIPVIGETGTTFAPIKIALTNHFNQNRILKGDAGDCAALEFSPVNRYEVGVSESDTQLSTPSYLFKSQNTNSRMFKYRRRLEGYVRREKPNDYRIYSQIILPFCEFTEGCLKFKSEYRLDGVMQDFGTYLTTRAKQFPSETTSLKLPVSTQLINRAQTSGRRFKTIPYNFGVWNSGVPTTVIPETYSLVGRELGIINWLSLS